MFAGRGPAEMQLLGQGNEITQLPKLQTGYPLSAAVVEHAATSVWCLPRGPGCVDGVPEPSSSCRVTDGPPINVARVTPPVDGHNTTMVSVRSRARLRSGGRSPHNGQGRAGSGNHRSRPPNHTTGTDTARSRHPLRPGTPDSRPSAPQPGARRRHAHTGDGRHRLLQHGEFAASRPLPGRPLTRAVDMPSQPRRPTRGNDRNKQDSSSGPIAEDARWSSLWECRC